MNDILPTIYPNEKTMISIRKPFDHKINWRFFFNTIFSRRFIFRSCSAEFPFLVFLKPNEKESQLLNFSKVTPSFLILWKKNVSFLKWVLLLYSFAVTESYGIPIIFYSKGNVDLIVDCTSQCLCVCMCVFSKPVSKLRCKVL